MITFILSYTASNQNEFADLVLATDTLLKRVKSNIPPAEPRKIHVRANYGKGGLIVLQMSEGNHYLPHADNALRFENVSFIPDRDKQGENNFHLVIGEFHFLVMYA